MTQHKHHAYPSQRRLLASAIGMLLASSALAQTETTTIQLPRISVETNQEQVTQPASPKFTAPLVDTPQTVSVIPSQVFQQQGAQTLTDVLKNTPGISFNAGENGFGTNTNNFQMRGFDTSGSVFIDGTRDSGNYARDVFNLEQVEVAKGPAGDNGRGGAGGYINLVTKTPKLENRTLGSLSYGFDNYDSEDRRRLTLDSNYTVADNAAVRLNVLLQNGGIAGREWTEENSLGIAPSLAFGLGTDTRVILAYQHLRQNDRPDWGVPAATVKGTVNYNWNAARADRDNFYGLKSDFDDVESDSFTFRVEHDFSDSISLSNQTRWSQTDRRARYTVPTGYTAPATASTQTQLYQRDNETLSNLTNLTLRFGGDTVKHTVSAGLELTKEESDAKRFGTGTSNTNIFYPDPNRTGGLPMNPSATNAVEVETVALYVYDTIELGDHWQITGGLRWEEYKVEIDSKNAAGGSDGAFDGYDEKESSISGKIGLVFKPADNGSIYLSYGVSHLPGGSFLANPDISRTGDNAFPGLVADARVKKSVNYELGTKWEFFDERLITSVAVFRTEQRNAAITGRDRTAGEPGTTLKGYGKQIAQGIELGINGKITENWDIFAGAVYLDTERKHSAELDRVRCEANPADYRAGAAWQDCAADGLRTNGDRLAFTPRITANLWTTYRFPVGLTIGGGVQHVGEVYAGRPDDASRMIPNGRYGKLPDYTVFNLMASYEVSDNLTLRFNVDNVTDEKYANSANWPVSRATLGDPRTFLLSADFSF